MFNTGKPLTTPLLAAGLKPGRASPTSTTSPASASAPPTDEWDCRGFEPKPPSVTDGIQIAHDGPISFVRNLQSSPKFSWAAKASETAHAEIVRKQRRLLKAIVASAAVMLIELSGGIYAHSLALMSDSAHMLADIASYCIALVALEVALPLDLEAAGGCGPREVIHQKLSRHASYGLHRVEVLGGLGSIMIIWFTAGGLLYEGISRLAAQLFGGLVPTIDGVAFVLVAACGLVCNALILWLFRDVAHGAHGHGDGHDHGHSHGGGDENVTARAAVVHAMGDIAQSVGMLLTATLITIDGARWSILDPLVTIICSLYMLYGTLGLLREVFLVLIEATPKSVDAHAVRDALRKRSEVHAIRCFHVWALAPGKVMLTACVQVTEACEDTDDVLRELQTVCRYRFGIHHATFQVTRDADLM